MTSQGPVKFAVAEDPQNSTARPPPKYEKIFKNKNKCRNENIHPCDLENQAMGKPVSVITSDLNLLMHILDRWLLLRYIDLSASRTNVIFFFAKGS